MALENIKYTTIKLTILLKTIVHSNKQRNILLGEMKK